MRAGLLTIHNCDNFGAVLQASATIRILSESGLEVELIDYSTPDVLSANKLFKVPKSKRAIMDDLRNGLMYSTVLSRRKRFREYKEEFYKLSTQSFSTPEELNHISSAYDLFITGSDQTFNLNLQGDPKYRMPYFMNFTTQMKFSFASSMGDSIGKITKNEKAFIVQSLPRFDMISVRDEPTQLYLSSIVDKEIVLMADPTICVSKSFWNGMLPPCNKSGYILFYSVVSDSWVIDRVVGISKALNMPVICPHLPNKYEIKSHFVRNAGIGPREFLNLINNAELVLTTSFHACVFSLLFHIPFFAFCIGEGNRIKSLLKQVGLSQQLVNKEDLLQINAIPVLDFSKADSFFCNERIKAKQYIERIIDVVCSQKTDLISEDDS